MRRSTALTRAPVAGAIGTVAMDLLWYSRYRRGGGDEDFPAWEFTGDLESWDDAPAPAQVARKLVGAVLDRDIPLDKARLANNVMHWGYGAGWATVLAVAGRRGRLWRGPVFGTLVWASDYVVLPVLGIYQPIWTYDRETLAQDLSAHVVYGTATDLALRALAR
jgi:hypothetical protein